MADGAIMQREDQTHDKTATACSCCMAAQRWLGDGLNVIHARNSKAIGVNRAAIRATSPSWIMGRFLTIETAIVNAITIKPTVR